MHIEGTFLGIGIVAPYGYYRTLRIKTDKGEKLLRVGFQTIEQQTKGLKPGDKIEVHYVDYDTYTITKL